MNWMRTIPQAPADAGGAAGGAAPAGGGAATTAAAPAAAAASPGGDAAGAAAKTADGAAAVAPAAAAAPVVTTGYRPEGIPDHFVGTTDKETIDNLFKAADGFRKAQADRGEMPKDAKGYEFKPSDVVKPYADNLGNDPFMGKVQEAAFKHGIPKTQFNSFINDVLGEMVFGQMVDAPFDADKERALLLPDVKDAKERTAGADKMASEAIARVKIWKEQGLPEPIANDLLSRMDRASTIQLTKWIADGRREAAPAMGGAPAGGVTQASLNERQTDPRNKIGDNKYDPAYAAETTRLYKVLYPDSGNR